MFPVSRGLASFPTKLKEVVKEVKHLRGKVLQQLVRHLIRARSSLVFELFEAGVEQLRGKLVIEGYVVTSGLQAKHVFSLCFPREWTGLTGIGSSLGKEVAEEEVEGLVGQTGVCC